MDNSEADCVKYWMEELQKAKEVDSLTPDCYDVVFRKGEYSLVMDGEDIRLLSLKCNNKKILQYSYLLTALKVTLAKYILNSNITIGVPYYNVNQKKIITASKIIPITTAVDFEQTFKEYFTIVNKKVLEAYSKQNMLDRQILLKINMIDLMDVTPISICMKALHDDASINYICDSRKNEILFLFELINEQSIKLKVVYNSGKFSENYIKKLIESYQSVIKITIEDVNKKIKDIEIMSNTEKNKLLYEFNDTKLEYCKDKMIHEIFQEQVDKTPNDIAVVCGENKLTYRELNEKSNQVARVLRKNGIKANSIVGILVDRSVNMMVSIMGVLKAGAAYLPLDIIYPLKRINYMLEEGSVQALILDDKSVSIMNFNGYTLDINDASIYKEKNENLNIINKSSDLAYVIFTSGSTGNPKGVMIEHRQVNNFIHGIVKATNLNIYTSILCITTVCFDIFGLETLVPLTQGLKVVIANGKEQLDSQKLSALIEKNKVEVMQSTPSRLKVLLESESFERTIKAKTLRLLLLGGEELQQNIVDKIPESSDLKIFNVYGPTETTIWSTIKAINKNEKITIGKPISNTQIYILNNDKILPIGVIGELCIAGDGLSRGYINSPELTSEKFIDNPFGINKIYKTGDLAKWLENGEIEYLGRIDNQVKVRGFRIELSEIEDRLLKHEDIKEAVVVVKENKNLEKNICAYIVSSKDINMFELKDYLKKKLPEYMIPSYFIKLKEMPLTLNGKVDKKSFPQPEDSLNIGNLYVPARNEIDEALIEIWSEVLQINTNKISIEDNFFSIGGNSLLAIKLNNLLNKNFHYNLPMIEFYKNPTIHSSSDYLAQINTALDIKQINEKLHEKFNKNIRLINYYNNNNNFLVLEASKSIDEIINYLQYGFKGLFFPEYIVNYDEQLLVSKDDENVSLNDLNARLRLVEPLESEINNLIGLADDNSILLKNSIICGKPIFMNKLGYILNNKNHKFQKREERGAMFIATEAVSLNNEKSILNSIKKLINDQNVLRMVLYKEDEQYYYKGATRCNMKSIA